MLSESFKAFGANRALYVHDTTYSYADLDLASRLIALKLQGDKVAILVRRSFETYASIAASIRSGKTYIPLSSEQPDSFLQQQLSSAMPDVLVVDRTMVSRAQAILESLEPPVPVLCIDADRDLVNKRLAPPAEEVDRQSENALYQMFTSGTTGQPKRIAIPRSNVGDYLTSIRSLFDFGPDDRFSQFFKLTFDLSVHDMLVAWTCGGCLYVPRDMQLMDPVSFAKKHDLSVWFSVPSLARLAMMARKLSPRALPRLRHALFCGEALPWQVVTAFAKAAPNAALTNLYGPTEATIAITWNRLPSEPWIDGADSQGPVPIGGPFAGQEAAVVDENLKPLPDGRVGELLLGGSQLAPGYCEAPDLTAPSFLDMRIVGFESERWYRTGDLVRHDAGELTFMGRVDTQVKFRGHRIELGVIEAALADEAMSPLAVVLPSYQSNDGSTIEKLVGLVASPREPLDLIRMKLIERLPSHMVPSEVIEIPPHGAWWNQNGKVDRSKLRHWHASHRLEAVRDR